MLKEQRYFKIAAALFLIGIAVSAYLVNNHHQVMNGENVRSFCNINQYFDCDTVNSSEYSVFLGIPFATWGLGWYIFATILALMAGFSAYAVRDVAFLLVPGTLVSLALSVVLAVISVVKINALCIMCTALHVVNFLAAGVVLWGSRTFLKSAQAEFQKVDRRRLLTMAASGGAILAITALATAQLERRLPFDGQRFRSSFEGRPKVSIDIGQSPRLGATNPVITLVEFSDFECPFCGRQSREMVRILRRYKNEVQLVFKNFPLDMSCNPAVKVVMHQSACQAARAGWCAEQQGKFDPFHLLMFSNQRELTLENMKRWATEVGMDPTALENCVNSNAAKDYVANDIHQALALKVGSTPTFYINGRQFEGGVTAELIEYLLKNRDLLQ